MNPAAPVTSTRSEVMAAGYRSPRTEPRKRRHPRCEGSPEVGGTIRAVMPPWAPSIADAALSWGTVPAWLRYLIAFLIPLVATLILTPMAGRLAGRFDVMDRPGASTRPTGATPYLGGVAVAGGLLLVGVALRGEPAVNCCGARRRPGARGRGVADDVQACSRGSGSASRPPRRSRSGPWGVRAGAFETWLDLPITVLWVVAVMNAFNMIDNMDGIAAGVAGASAAGSR